MKNSIVLLLSIAMLACNSEEPVQKESKTDDVQTIVELMQRIPSLDTGRIQVKRVPNVIRCSGAIGIPPTDRYSIHSPASGFVKDLKYIMGDKIRRGALLASIENPEFITMQRKFLALRARLKLARSNLQRQKALDAEGATTSQQLTSALSEWEATKAEYTGVGAELMYIGIDTARLLSTESYQQSILLSSPASGEIASVQINNGQYISPETTLYEINGTSHIHVELNILSHDLPLISEGDSVWYKARGVEGENLALVIKKPNRVDPSTGMAIIHCHPAGDLDPGVVPGLYVDARVTGTYREITSIPKTGTVRTEQGFIGFIVETGRLQRVFLEDATVTEDYIQFTPNAQQEDKVWITSGAYYLE